MADAEVTMFADVVERAITAGTKLPAGMVLALRDVTMMVGMRIQARAQDRTPRDSGTLTRSAHTTGQRVGADFGVSITFGGLASKYAEVQHENPDLTHTSAAWMARYGFARGKTWRSSLKTQRSAVYNATGSRHRLPGHKGGYDHWLHSGPHAAWNATAQRWAAMQLDEAAAVIAERHLGGTA